MTQEIKQLTHISDFTTGEIYKQDYTGTIIIFRATSDLVFCNKLNIDKKVYQEREGYYADFSEHPTYTTTQEEKDWFVYCESVGEYRTKEESLDNLYVREFIEQYLK